MALKTNYKDDVFTGSRKYKQVNNSDGTVSFTDMTTYAQKGDTYGAAQINEVNDIINGFSTNMFKSTDSVGSSLADDDKIPFYDTSASKSKVTLWSTIKTAMQVLFPPKDHHSNSAATYGAGTASQFGHVKLSNSYLASDGAAANSVGASSQAVYSAYNKLNGQLKANGKEIYLDYKQGKYGYNTSSTRGADTFYPFKSSSSTVGTFSAEVIRYTDGKIDESWSTGKYDFKMSGDGYYKLTKSRLCAGNYDSGEWNIYFSCLTIDITIKNNRTGSTATYTRQFSDGVIEKNVSNKYVAYEDGDTITISIKLYSTEYQGFKIAPSGYSRSTFVASETL